MAQAQSQDRGREQVVGAAPFPSPFLRNTRILRGCCIDAAEVFRMETVHIRIVLAHSEGPAGGRLACMDHVRVVDGHVQ
jgi:hypothetical protein